jgi:gliding motility-associated-like protein
MNKFILLTLALFPFNNQAFGQENTILNYSFEIISDCPDDFLTGGIGLAEFWSSAMSTPDIYNACAPFDFGGVPINTTNCYQLAHSGNGYAGIAPFYTIPRTTEYMEVKLKEKLIKGKRYFVRFYVSARNCSDPEICYSDAMGLAFSNTFYQEDVVTGAEQIPPFVPAIQNPTGNIIKDTLNWMEISGCYTATGTEQYAIIGSFKTSANTQSEGCVGVTGSYYYIDDVGVYEYDPLPDTLILCSGETRTIGKSFLNASYLWNTGATDSTLTINQEGRYIVNAVISNCTLSDTIIVLEMDKLSNALPSDTLLCEGETLVINIPITGNYTWSSGETSNNISISAGGVYSVSIQNDCGLLHHTFEVTSEVCDCNVYVPNAFSPNNDGNNDFLKCFIGCDFPYQSTRFQIFDRWGSLVYSNKSTDNQSIIWDGTFKGKALDTGVYVWVFEYEYYRNGVTNKKIISGDVSILK